MEYLNCTLVLIGSVLIASVFSVDDIFMEIPKPLTVKLGSSAVFNCRLNKPPSHNVHWSINGNSVDGFKGYVYNKKSGRGIYDLTIEQTTIRDDGIILCNVGSVSSPPVNLTLIAAPFNSSFLHIREGLLDVVKAEVSYAICSVVKSKPPAIISWRFDNQLVTDLTTVNTVVTKYEDPTTFASRTEDAEFSNTVSTLTFNTSSPHQVVVECIVKHPSFRNDYSHSAYLNIQYAPSIDMVLKNKDTLKEGDLLEATCGAVGNPNIVALSWMLGDAIIEGEHTHTLKIQEISKNDNGKQLKCIAKNIIGENDKFETLDIAYKPSFLTTDIYIGASIGDSTILDCEVVSNPEANYKWTDENNQLKSTKAKLTFDEIKDEDYFGKYTCLVSVSGYEPISRTIHLLINDKPSISAESTQYSKFGADGLILCDVISMPKADSIVWYRNGEVVESKGRVSITNEEMLTRTRSKLFIRQVQTTDYSEYNCTAENQYGSDYQVIQFHRKAAIKVTYIIVMVLGGVVFLICIIVVIFMCQRRNTTKDSTSSGSVLDSELERKRDDLIKVSQVANPVEVWRNDNLSNNEYSHYSDIRPNYSTIDSRYNRFDDGYSDRRDEYLNQFNAASNRCVSQLSTNV